MRYYGKDKEPENTEREEHGDHRRKFRHDEVDYSRGKPHAHCSICEHFEPSGPHCVLVQDPIAPQMWCEEFEPE